MARFVDVRELEVDRLVVSQQQARTRDVEKGLDDLVNNIRVHGQLEPIIVAPSSTDDSKFEIIAGQRRWLAMQRLGAGSVLAAILDEAVDEATARVLSISENLVRQDLNAKDLIDACTALHRKYGSIKAVAEELGLPYGKVRSYVKFERLRPQLKDLVEAGRIDVRAAVQIEDHYGDREADAAELTRTVEAVSGMTNAQRADYFKGSESTKPARPTRVANGATPAPASSDKPGSVRQIIVTLRSEEHAKLREWAVGRGIGQDRAAAEIIAAFLANRGRIAQSANRSGTRSPAR
jgi:ParB family chromosome partitioning protein